MFFMYIFVENVCERREGSQSILYGPKKFTIVLETCFRIFVKPKRYSLNSLRQTPCNRKQGTKNLRSTTKVQVSKRWWMNCLKLKVLNWIVLNIVWLVSLIYCFLHTWLVFQGNRDGAWEPMSFALYILYRLCQ